MIEVSNLSKFYGNTKAVEDVSFKVEEGEVVGLLGPNGAGKTTIMRVLTCYFTPTSGTALVNGYDCVNNSIEVKKITGYMPENPLLYQEMTVENYLKFISELRGISKKEKKSKINTMLERLNITNVRGKIIGRLSKGYKQRVGLASALIHDPKVLILDEPTIGLDPKQILEMRELIKSMAGSKTIILSSHILPEVSQICQRIVIIDKGHIVAIDTHEDLLRRLQGAERISVKLKGGENIIEKVRKINGVKAVLNELTENSFTNFTIDCEMGVDIREDLFKLIVKNGSVIYELKANEMSLEDVFLKLTTHEEIQ